MYLTEDLSNLKDGDRAYCIFLGWGKIVKIDINSDDGFVIAFNPDSTQRLFYFSREGFYFSSFKIQTLFTREIEMDFAINMEYENNK